MKRYVATSFCVLIISWLSITGCSASTNTKLPDNVKLIPYPSEVMVTEGEFILDGNTLIIFNNAETQKIAEYMSEVFESTYNINAEILREENPVDKNFISLNLDPGLTNLGEEGYEMVITSESVKLSAAKPAGLFYAVQSLLQLIPIRENNTPVKLPAMKITDKPRYVYRGMHLDVCRHFMPKEFIKKYIDYLAMYKFNRFHWHLTDDQGWRIEIKKYPKLTEIGAWRDETLIGHSNKEPYKFDGVKHGGFYTQEDIKEIIDYASSKYITVIPEIELPGHALAALASYPEYSCTGGPFDVPKWWDVFDDVYCAGKEETFKFLEDVLDEVTQLFPSDYIHIGGDECPKVRWKECPDCQKRIADEGLKDEFELQSYFIKRIEKFVTSKGKRIIGWDEILEGGLAPEATVMSWRGMEGGIEAANQGHNVIMTPTHFSYFDYYQGDKTTEPLAIGGYLPISEVYKFEPTPVDIAEDKQHFILGGQANVWTEYIPNPKHAEYMVFPRIAAMAEVLWSPYEARNWEDFSRRVKMQFPLFDKLGINYSKTFE